MSTEKLEPRAMLDDLSRLDQFVAAMRELRTALMPLSRAERAIALNTLAALLALPPARLPRVPDWPECGHPPLSAGYRSDGEKMVKVPLPEMDSAALDDVKRAARDLLAAAERTRNLSPAPTAPLPPWERPDDF